ncbi:MAG: isopentenyl-diphosphate Delta-isomerase [Nitrosopumilus sp.]|jgi:isopentenyl-diphosphate delta-isomerase|uniref:isopentenyl-diphosphate Delta-isomerase n=1 Tax=Nitrosopumilus sp. TaxID=2024843 RepID=UPI0024713771|nr:isopentenyl-diphosphate Delta-isomerase [Nitrosopumilus sp.]MDH5430452.1 isopentenyl-diphosphate Delta-isomerase [Nitrosopumilus sp.]MDH5665639.1 isopentenyl-diphosphate Delta-isomerase [Nitrosopumilus sp.]
MSDEFVILVDENDNPIGTEEKVKCHLPNGKLHRAFTALLFDKEGRLVLTRRAKEKMLWPNDWDGTFASHPRESETYVSSGERRMPEELGINSTLDYLHKFEYHVPYKKVGSENEICGTLIGVIDKSTELKEIEGEIDEIKWISSKELLVELKTNPEIYCPWMLIALELLEKSNKSMLEKHANVLSTWMSREIHDELQKAIKIHLPDDKWRLVNEKN